MASCCGGGGTTKSTSGVKGYQVTTYSGEKFGPFLTVVEARVKLTEAGGGVITEIRGTA